MVDRPPPSRFSVVERGGRLVVIDRETGQTPPTAAERMDAHDRRMGVEPSRPATRVVVEPAAIVETAPAPERDPPRLPNDRMAAAVAAMNNNKKRPWTDGAKPRSTVTPPQPARIPQRPAPQTGRAIAHKTIVTGKWWDAKGPRTIELGAKGQQVLSSGFVTLFFVALIVAIVALFVEPLLLFAGAFVLFRFGGTILGPIGASLIDKALAEQG
ncbi:MAG: hypothetical protein C0520_00640 [Sphingopyxis sp.]|nr:hypothetical protein [Sphingopyxis sp.]